MRPPRPLGSRRVDDGEVEEIQWSASSKAHRRELNLETCAAIRRTMAEQTGHPTVELIVPEHGPPSVVFEPLYDPCSATQDAAKWDRQARSFATGKYIKTRR
jgi:hypothetical protein